MKHLNIPIFIPHDGCKNECVFCNQRVITGQENTATVRDIRERIESFVKSRIECENIGTEIAFFGGSFTGIERSKMTSFLTCANEYIGKNNITGIRLSTRPDYIDDEILAILQNYNVKAIELGIQSMSDDVLKASKRGHTTEHTTKAAEKIKSRGFLLTGQMMLGLPSSNREKDMETAYKMAQLDIDSARIYPTVIFKATELYSMYKSGNYAPISLDEAVYRAKEIKKLYSVKNIPIIRMGLCASDNLGEGGDFVGPYHPAFGEMVESALYFDAITNYLDENNIRDIERLVIHAINRDISKITGQRKSNTEKLKHAYNIKEITIKKDEKFYIEVEN